MFLRFFLRNSLFFVVLGFFLLLFISNLDEQRVKLIVNFASWWNNIRRKSIFVQSVKTTDELVCEMKTTQLL